MKKLFSILFLLCLVYAFAIAEQNKTVAVTIFEVKGNAVSKDEAETMTELYIRVLENVGNVLVRDIGKLSNLLKELKFQESNCSDARKTKRLGGAINAKVICRCKISKLGNKLYISLTFIEAKDDIAYECTEHLGYMTFEKAKELAEQYRGGGYDDWSLPNGDLLTDIYRNLVKSDRQRFNFLMTYWTMLDRSNKVRVRRFLDGSNDKNYFLSPKSIEHGTAAVRAFKISELE